VKESRSALIDLAIFGILLVLSVVTLWSLGFTQFSRWVTLGAMGSIVVIALALVAARFATRGDHLRAMQSHKILGIANEALTHLGRA
jgi:hypothetical protein